MDIRVTVSGLLSLYLTPEVSVVVKKWLVRGQRALLTNHLIIVAMYSLTLTWTWSSLLVMITSLQQEQDRNKGFAYVLHNNLLAWMMGRALVGVWLTTWESTGILGKRTCLCFWHIQDNQMDLWKTHMTGKQEQEELHRISVPSTIFNFWFLTTILVDACFIVIPLLSTVWLWTLIKWGYTSAHQHMSLCTWSLLFGEWTAM